jgi:hypothetical protein
VYISYQWFVLRFPTNIVPSLQKEQMISTQRQYNPVQGSSRIMRSSTEFCGFPYFLDAPDNVHVYSEHQSFAMQDYSSLPEMDSAYRCQYEDVTAGKEKCYQGFQSNKQFKSTNSTSLPKTSSQQVRFNLSKKQTTSNIPHSKMTDTVSLKTSKVGRLNSYWTNCTFGLYPSSGVSKNCVFWSVSSCVTNCHLGFFPWLLVFGCMWVCVCLGLYAILVFPRF